MKDHPGRENKKPRAFFPSEDVGSDGFDEAIGRGETLAPEERYARARSWRDVTAREPGRARVRERAARHPRAIKTRVLAGRNGGKRTRSFRSSGTGAGGRPVALVDWRLRLDAPSTNRRSGCARDAPPAIPRGCAIRGLRVPLPGGKSSRAVELILGAHVESHAGRGGPTCRATGVPVVHRRVARGNLTTRASRRRNSNGVDAEGVDQLAYNDRARGLPACSRSTKRRLPAPVEARRRADRVRSHQAIGRQEKEESGQPAPREGSWCCIRVRGIQNKRENLGKAAGSTRRASAAVPHGTRPIAEGEGWMAGQSLPGRFEIAGS